MTNLSWTCCLFCTDFWPDSCVLGLQKFKLQLANELIPRCQPLLDVPQSTKVQCTWPGAGASSFPRFHTGTPVRRYLIQLMIKYNKKSFPRRVGLTTCILFLHISSLPFFL
eukprot:g69788.t1